MIQYSPGSVVNNTFTPVTKADMCDNIRTNLVNAGWASSGSSPNYTLTSVATSQSLQLKIVTSAADTNCARLTLKNASGSLTATTVVFLLPDSTTWRIIANNYGFWVMKDSSPTVDKRDFGFAFTPYVPSWTGITECCVAGGRCLSDSSTAACRSFRDALTHDGNNSNTGAYCTITNGTMVNVGTFEADQGTLRFKVGGSAIENTNDLTNAACSTFFDGTIFMETPYIAYGASGTTNIATCQGVVYDSVIVEQSYAYGTTKSFDSKTWMAITHNNTGNSTNRLLRGTLFARIS